MLPSKIRTEKTPPDPVMQSERHNNLVAPALSLPGPTHGKGPENHISSFPQKNMIFVPKFWALPRGQDWPLWSEGPGLLVEGRALSSDLSRECG